MTTNPDEGDLLLRVTGFVPAEEFHPYVLRVARRFGHDSAGALIRAVGYEDQLVRFVRAIRDDAPAAVRIRSLDPELITADTPIVGDKFAALAAETIEWHDPAPDHTPPLAHVA
jgi:hydrogenase maturation factor HypF (carbamoyltransferase family)